MISLKLLSFIESISEAVINKPLSSSFNLVSLSFRTIEVFIGDILSIFFLAVSLKKNFLLAGGRNIYQSWNTKKFKVIFVKMGKFWDSLCTFFS